MRASAATTDTRGLVAGEVGDDGQVEDGGRQVGVVPDQGSRTGAGAAADVEEAAAIG